MVLVQRSQSKVFLVTGLRLLLRWDISLVNMWRSSKTSWPDILMTLWWRRRLFTWESMKGRSPPHSENQRSSRLILSSPTNSFHSSERLWIREVLFMWINFLSLWPTTSTSTSGLHCSRLLKICAHSSRYTLTSSMSRLTWSPWSLTNPMLQHQASVRQPTTFHLMTISTRSMVQRHCHPSIPCQCHHPPPPPPALLPSQTHPGTRWWTWARPRWSREWTWWWWGWLLRTVTRIRDLTENLDRRVWKVRVFICTEE